MTSNDGKHVLITGASTGIGRATALRLDQAGYSVIAGVRRGADGEALRQTASPRLRSIILDVTDAAQIAEAHTTVAAWTGDRGLYALVNNAGLNYNAAFEFTDGAKARAVMEVNFFGLYRLSQAMLPLLRKSAATGETAKLVNIGSIGNVVGLPWEAFYHASKFALLGLSESLSHEVHRQGIRVTVIQPGGIKTPFMDKTRESIATAVAALPTEGAQLYAKGLTRLGEMTGSVDRLGSAPEQVAAAIHRVLAARNPPFRLFVGTDARLMNLTRQLLPTNAFHWLMRKSFAC
jgi:NAD(P)-dependent dehydrogenase (short-subunit alcohol dehydrogenase family)